MEQELSADAGAGAGSSISFGSWAESNQGENPCLLLVSVSEV